MRPQENLVDHKIFSPQENLVDHKIFSPQENLVVHKIFLRFLPMLVIHATKEGKVLETGTSKPTISSVEILKKKFENPEESTQGLQFKLLGGKSKAANKKHCDPTLWPDWLAPFTFGNTWWGTIVMLFSAWGLLFYFVQLVQICYVLTIMILVFLNVDQWGFDKELETLTSQY